MMLRLIGLLVPVMVLAQSADFCIQHDPHDKGSNPTTCYTNWPTKASVCPHHKYWIWPYSYIEPETMARDVGSVKFMPPVCKTESSGRLRCDTEVLQPDASQEHHPLVHYATLWTYKTFNAQKIPTFYYGGLYWKSVRFYTLHCEIVEARIGRTQRIQRVQQTGVFDAIKTQTASITQTHDHEGLEAVSSLATSTDFAPARNCLEKCQSYRIYQSRRNEKLLRAAPCSFPYINEPYQA